MKKVIVIGAGVSGLSCAACLAQEGFDVTVIEKNTTPGGRVGRFETHGFAFDMGPSWYWMPDVFEDFFKRFGKRVSDYYRLERLDPSYRVYFGQGSVLDVPADIAALRALFERVEPGSGAALRRFLDEGAYKYGLAMHNLAYKPGLSLTAFTDVRLMSATPRLHLFRSMSRHIRKYFHDDRLVRLLEFPVLFLGASAEKIPALYSFMNYADLALGTWYPRGGLYRIIDAMTRLCREQGATLLYNAPVTRIEVASAAATGVWSDGAFYPGDYVVATADYWHVEQHLLPEAFRRYRPEYWDTRAMSPSCLIFFVGLNTRIPNLLHHTLFFDTSRDAHVAAIYDHPQWPAAPQFYVCCPSKTDSSTAPEGCENLFILIPVAADLSDRAEIRDRYFQMAMARIETLTRQPLLKHVIVKRSYAHNDFISDYNAFKGNAYGLANTLRQTANLKPEMASRKVKNLFYAGQLTVPGPGLPPCLISGQIAAAAVLKRHRRNK